MKAVIAGMKNWFVAIAFAVAIDITVRQSTEKWSEFPLFQWAVTLSPLVYILFFVVLIHELQHIPQSLSERAKSYSVWSLIVCSIVVIVQVFVFREGVGSAVYSIVQPLFFSGIPLAVLTFIVFFIEKRNQSFMCFLALLLCVLWVLCPVAVDAMYLMQGGYRGPGVALDETPVIGTTYSFFQFFLGYLFFPNLLLILVTLITGSIIVIRSGKKLNTAGIMLSILAFQVQVLNWGGFIWD